MQRTHNPFLNFHGNATDGLHVYTDILLLGSFGEFIPLFRIVIATRVVSSFCTNGSKRILGNNVRGGCNHD